MLGLSRVTLGFETVNEHLFAERHRVPEHQTQQIEPGVKACRAKPFTLKQGEPVGPLPSPPALGEAWSQPLPGEEGRSRHPTLFLLGGHMLQNPPHTGAFRLSVRMYSLWLLH